MASEPYSVKPYEGPIHHTEGQWYNVIGPNGHRLNLRPMPPDEANHLARILNSASSAAADEVGRLREQVAFLNRAGSVYEAEAKAARLMLTDAGLPVHYSLTREQLDATNEDSHEYINARAGTDEFIASLATDASGAMTSALSPIPSAAKEKKQ